MTGAGSLFPKDSDSKLKGEINYLPWSILFRKAATTIGCDGLLTGAMVKPDPNTHPDEYVIWYTMDLYITTLMLQCIQPSMFASINQMSAADSWNRLYMAYGPKGSGSIMTQFRRLTHPLPVSHNLKTLESHLEGFEAALVNLRQAGYDIDEGFASAILVTTLPYDPNDNQSWYNWIQKFTLVQGHTMVASTASDILNTYRAGHPEEANPGSVPTSSIKAANLQMEAAYASQGKYFCTNCQSTKHDKRFCTAPGGGRYSQGGKSGNSGGKGGKGKRKGRDKAHPISESGGVGDSEQTPSSTSNFVSLAGANAIDFSAYPASDQPTSSNPLQSVSEQVYPAGTTADRPPIIIDSGTMSHIHSVRSDFTSFHHPAISQSVTGFGAGTMKIIGRGIDKTPAASSNTRGLINIFVEPVERCLYNMMYTFHFYTPPDTLNVFNNNTYYIVCPQFNIVELAISFNNTSPPCHQDAFNASLNIFVPLHSDSVQPCSTSR